MFLLFGFVAGRGQLRQRSHVRPSLRRNPQWLLSSRQFFMRITLIRIWRVLALTAAAVLLHLAASRENVARSSSSISLEQAHRYFPAAQRIVPASDTDDRAPEEVRDSENRQLGFMAKTSPQADQIIGYSGPNNVLVALNASGRILGLELLSSGDTEAHVRAVQSSNTFLKQFTGWTPSHEPLPKIEAVGGSTLTSLGIAEALQKRLAGRVDSLRFPEPVTLAEVQQLFPGGVSFENQPERPGWHRVKNQSGQSLGFAVRTSPWSDYTLGHNGPTESLVAVTADAQRILGIRLRKSYDTDDYVESVREDAQYLAQLTNFTVAQWAALDLKKAGLEGVSGATETSFAVAEGIRRRFAADATQAVAVKKLPLKPRDWALLGIISGSLVMTFTALRGKRFARIAWQALLIGVFGLWFGDLLSIALLAGWARHGVAWQVAPALVLLVAVALVVPWATRRQLYCYQLCPHGAAQEWLGRFPKLQVRLSARLQNGLRFFPPVLLAIAFLIALTRPQFNLAALEPFDAWSLRGAVMAASVIAVIGLVASLFVPMAYCRFGCPTGALLKFIRTRGSDDTFGGKDKAALGLLLAGSLLVWWPARSVPAKVSGENAPVELHGTAFGTTWNVKLRQRVPDTARLETSLGKETERIESTLSHWRTTSWTSRFNHARTTQPMEMPEELVTLVARCLEISRASGGAFDITVGPLVQAWGFGPGKPRTNAPSLEEINQLRRSTGWKQLMVDTNTWTLQKSAPELQIDLGAILQGYAADRLAQLLETEGTGDFLINVGGELRARGSWRVAVENPTTRGEPLRVIQLENSSLATSGTYRAQHQDGKRHWSHLIDPSTGQPVEHGTTLVSVVTPSCAEADAWATTLLVAGNGRAQELAKARNLAMLVVSGGQVNEWKFPVDGGTAERRPSR